MLRLFGNVFVDMIISIYISLVESYLLDVMCDVIGGKIENEIFDFFIL